MELIKLNDYLESKNLTENEISKEDAFKAGQIAFIASIADTLGVSMAYNGLQWVDEIGRILKERRQENEIRETIDDSLSKLKKRYKKPVTSVNINGKDVKI